MSEDGVKDSGRPPKTPGSRSGRAERRRCRPIPARWTLRSWPALPSPAPKLLGPRLARLFMELNLPEPPEVSEWSSRWPVLSCVTWGPCPSPRQHNLRHDPNGLCGGDGASCPDAPSKGHRRPGLGARDEGRVPFTEGRHQGDSPLVKEGRLCDLEGQREEGQAEAGQRGCPRPPQVCGGRGRTWAGGRPGPHLKRPLASEGFMLQMTGIRRLCPESSVLHEHRRRPVAGAGGLAEQADRGFWRRAGRRRLTKRGVLEKVKTSRAVRQTAPVTSRAVSLCLL